MFRRFGFCVSFLGACFSVIILSSAVLADEGYPRGTWEAPCDAWGTAAICRSVWAEGMHSSHSTQTYSITHAETGDVMFAGRGLYRIDGADVRGYWEDSQGAVHPLLGSWDGTALQVIWGTPETEVGRSTYTLSNVELTTVDEVQDDGAWRTFMTVSYGAAQ